MNKKITPTYKHIHNRFRLNGNHYTTEELVEVAYSFIKEGQPHEQAIGDFLMDWLHSKETIELKTSGSTGEPKKMSFSKQALVHSALATGDFFGLQVGDKALLCLNPEYVAGKMMLVRALILGLELDLVPPQGNVLSHSLKHYDFVAMVPIQVKNALSNLNRIRTLLIGGAPSSKDLQQKLQALTTSCFETYGMTETLTHIAVRPMDAESNFFQLLPGVQITQDKRECLVIHAPRITEQNIITNDLVDLCSDHSFRLRGRADNVINTGGHKVLPEEIEQQLSEAMTQPFFIGGIPDQTLGEKVVLLTEGDCVESLEKIFERVSLSTYAKPKELICLESFVYTDNGKIRRKETLATLNL